jgi:hypothetical protein
LYTQQVPETKENIAKIIGTIAGESKSKKDIELVLIKACVFGGRFLAWTFKRDIHNFYVTYKERKPPWYENVKYAFENLDEDDILLKFMVDMQCITWHPDADGKDEEVVHRVLLPSAFLVRVMIRNYELKKSPVAKKDVKLCSYHSHEERKACPQH